MCHQATGTTAELFGECAGRYAAAGARQHRVRTGKPVEFGEQCLLGLDPLGTVLLDMLD